MYSFIQQHKVEYNEWYLFGWLFVLYKKYAFYGDAVINFSADA